MLIRLRGKEHLAIAWYSRECLGIIYPFPAIGRFDPLGRWSDCHRQTVINCSLNTRSMELSTLFQRKGKRSNYTCPSILLSKAHVC
jgi:hypothetical protein